MPTIERNAIVEMLEKLGKAVSSGDLKGVSACYAFPAFFLIEGDATVFEEPEEFKKLFAQGREWYVSQGIIETRPEILKVDSMTEKLASVDVRWPGFDADGAEVYSETSHYILQTADGEPRIRVAFSRTLPPC